MNQDNSIGRTAIDNVANHFFARSRTTIAVAGRIESGKERRKEMSITKWYNTILLDAHCKRPTNLRLRGL